MIISIPTQIEMYNYILSNKSTGTRVTEENLDNFIALQIRELAKKQYYKSELYIGKIIIKKNNHKLKKDKNYKCKSNQLIYFVLNQFPEGETFLTDKIINQLRLEVPEDYLDVPENGSDGRKKLVQLCKLFISSKDIELVSKRKSEDDYKLAKESFLAEATFGKYCKKTYGNEHKVYVQKLLKKGTSITLGLRADIVICAKNITIIVDVKVYNTVGEYYYNKFIYSSNDNRNQVNSYIGAFIEKYTKKKIVGILLHIVSDELWDKNKNLQGKCLSVEDNRPIYLYMIKATDLHTMQSDFKSIIDYELTRKN